VNSREYFPQEVFAGDALARYSPRVIVAPQRYLQGNGVLDQLGRYLSILPSRSPALLVTERGLKRVGERMLQSLRRARIEPVLLMFEGECSDEEVRRHVRQLENRRVDALIVAGGGKCLDAGKCVAHCLSVPVVVCPTLASTDAPCSAVSVMYTPEGVFDRPWFFPEGPALVVVDTGVIVRAPVRYLVAGMGDAMSTFYEARTCFRNPEARTMVGARPTAAAVAIAELGARLLFEDGVKALEAVSRLTVNDAVDNVVETNTLLSGLGFESGGLAAAHGIAQVLPGIPFVNKNYLHGEMVAMGLLAHLCLEGETNEALRIAGFFAEIGLPVHLGQLSLSVDQHGLELDGVVGDALKIFFVHNEPFEVTAQKLKQGLLQAHRLGLEVSLERGDEAYRRLHPSEGIKGGATADVP
jgi:glycerol dehydrogenase